MSLYQSFAVERCHAGLLLDKCIRVVILHWDFVVGVQVVHRVCCGEDLIVLAQIVIVYYFIEFAHCCSFSVPALLLLNTLCDNFPQIVDLLARDNIEFLIRMIYAGG